MRLVDHFDLDGPNGRHHCLVLEPLGPSVSDIAEARSDDRLPGSLARTVARQALVGLDFLHDRKLHMEVSYTYMLF